MSAHTRSDAGITIAELAALTDVGEGTLRMWETRYEVRAALQRARATITAAPTSIFAALREMRAELAPQPMPQPVLARVSRAIEDECLAPGSPEMRRATALTNRIIGYLGS